MIEERERIKEGEEKKIWERERERRKRESEKLKEKKEEEKKYILSGRGERSK